MTGQFVHLHVHSDCSFSEGVSKVDSLVAAAAANGQPAIALTDTDAMYGAYDFSKAALKKGVQPIVGVKLYLRVDEKTRGSIILLAGSDVGYRNICTLLAAAHFPYDENGDRRKRPLDLPLVPGELLQSHADDVFLLTGGRDGIFSQMFRSKDPSVQQNIQPAFDYLRHCFGDRFFIEICRNGSASAEDVKVESQLLDLAYSDSAIVCADGVERRGAPIVATTEVFYSDPDRHDAFEIAMAVAAKKTVAGQGTTLIRDHPLNYYLRTTAEMGELFSDLPEAIANTAVIAARCAFAVEGRKPILPPFPTMGGRTEAEELRETAMAGLAERLRTLGIPDAVHDSYYERLKFELDVIIKMEFPGYFLIVSDFIKWAKAQGIPVGPGRGSGAGSVVAWSLTITDLDPLRFGLLFERFLNPERVSMPDFDIDFCQDRRGEVIHYVQQKYGLDLVSAIVTFMVCKSKTALTDTARVFTHDKFGGFGVFEVKSLTKLIPDGEEGRDVSLEEAFRDVPELKHRLATDGKIQLLYDHARKIEGQYRGAGAHAAGIVIGGRPLYELVPTGWDETSNMPITHFNMKGVEACGLVKFDFLGLKTLSVLNEATSLIRETQGEDVDLSLIPLDDKNVLRLFAEADTNGIFQFESDGMKNVLKSVKPDRIEDLIAVNALFRPGPMDQIPLFASCKNGEQEPVYPRPVERTKPFLEETYGIMVYQEQVMKVAQEVAGYTLGGADLLRRAMGKKIKSEMDRERSKFVDGAMARGATQQEAESLFEHIEKFAGYGFNKSHAAAYSLIAYRAAWLKTYYPVEFFSALLTYEVGRPERMALFKFDMDERGIPLLPPDINRSRARFAPERSEAGLGGYGIRFGLSGIKGFAKGLDEFEKKRPANTSFRDLVDYDAKMRGFFNKKQIDALASVGAFDCLDSNRRRSASVLNWLAANKKDAKPAADLFGGAAPVVIPSSVADIEDWGDVADREFQAVGFYFNKHPLDRYLPRMIMAGIRRRVSYRAYMTSTRRAELENRYLAGMVRSFDRRVNKNGISYVRLHISERDEDYSVDFYETKGCSADALCSLVAAQIENRKPVAFVADIIQDSVGVFMKGSKLWDIDEFLQDFRGDFEVTIGADHITPTSVERRTLKEIEENGKASDVTLRKMRLQDDMVSRKIASIRESLSGSMIEEADGKGSRIRILVTAPGQDAKIVEMPGRYRMTIALESQLKTIDGLLDLKEQFSDEIKRLMSPTKALPAPELRQAAGPRQ